ncbi:MAG: hypothetical protein K2P79_01590 [Sphingomonas sp.]|nr:hypothetical protein [Sphingomonas sp.]
MFHVANGNQPALPIGVDALDAVAERLRAMAIDNFSLVGNIVRIGSAEWRLSECRCGFAGCDGWSIEPIDG